MDIFLAKKGEKSGFVEIKMTASQGLNKKNKNDKTEVGGN